MAEYQHCLNNTWMDAPTMINTSGFFTKDLNAGTRETQTVKILEAKQIDYDRFNRPVMETYSLDTGPDPVARFHYDAYGNMTKLTDERGNTSTTAFDPIYKTFPYTVTNALGYSEQYIMDPGTGNLVIHTDANGHTRTANYDGLGRITGQTNASGFEFVSYDYEFWSEIESVTDVYQPNIIRSTAWFPNGDINIGVWSEKHYDGRGREYQNLLVGQRGENDPIRHVIEYNDRDYPWKQSFPHWVSDSADAHWAYVLLENDDSNIPSGEKQWDHIGLSRTVQTLKELSAGDISSCTRTIYDTPLSKIIIDGRGNEKRMKYDTFDNLIGVWEPNEAGEVGSLEVPRGNFTRYNWDGLKRLETVRHHLDENRYLNGDLVTSIVYDELSRKTRLNDPDTGTTLYNYDAKGNLVSSIDARGLMIVREYDELDRLVRLTYPDVVSSGSLEQIYTYDTGSGNNLLGKLANVQTPDCTTACSYDEDGRITNEKRIIDNVTYEVTIGYDKVGRKSEMTYPDGMNLQYGYDPVTQALDSITNPDSGQIWLADIEMSPFKTAEQLVLGNGVTRQVEFDWSGRAQRLLTSSNAETLSDLNYTFDINSNITRIEEYAGVAPRGDMYYDYDPLNRLIKAYGTSMSGTDAGDSLDPLYSYNYDPLGRMTYNTRFLNPAYSNYMLEYQYSNNPGFDKPAHGVRGIRFTRTAEDPIYAHRFIYDPAGNLIQSTNDLGAVAGNGLDRTYLWDALGRLASLTNSDGTTSFIYDHAKARIKKTDPSGESVIYIGKLAEVTSEGMTKHIFAGKLRIATIQSDANKIIYNDRPPSVINNNYR